MFQSYMDLPMIKRWSDQHVGAVMHILQSNGNLIQFYAISPKTQIYILRKVTHLFIAITTFFAKANQSSLRCQTKEVADQKTLITTDIS